jgi:ApbE superfamily uncharacterized protein (UPF0280 family)
MKKNGLFRRAFRLKESNCTIIADIEDAINKAVASIEHHRKQLENYIQENPECLYSLKPVPVDSSPKVARLMGEASLKAGVGPMAAVAGVLADLAVEEMVSVGSKVAVVENGGEVSAISNKPVDIALAAGDAPLSREIGFRLKEFPVGVATSSGLYSHALSFGEAEAATVFAADAGVADAAATAVANLIKGEDVCNIIRKGLDRALGIEGVKGAFILYKGTIGKVGQVPELIKVNPRQ